VFTGISNFRYMVGLFDCLALSYYLLLVDDGLCRRKFVLYFMFRRHILHILWPIFNY